MTADHLLKAALLCAAATWLLANGLPFSATLACLGSAYYGCRYVWESTESAEDPP